VLVHDDARARVAAEMARLDVVGCGDDVEATLAPAVPDRREEHRPVGPVRREDRDERLLEEIAEVGGVEVLAHAAEV
jgi:hypothetical protein